MVLLRLQMRLRISVRMFWLIYTDQYQHQLGQGTVDLRNGFQSIHHQCNIFIYTIFHHLTRANENILAHLLGCAVHAEWCTVQNQECTRMSVPFVYIPYVYRKMVAYQNVTPGLKPWLFIVFDVRVRVGVGSKVKVSMWMRNCIVSCGQLWFCILSSTWIVFAAVWTKE